MNPYVKRMDALFGQITLMFLMLFVMSRSAHFRAFDRLLFWLSLIGGGYCGAMWLLLRLGKGKWLVPERMRNLPADSPAFRRPIYTSPRDKGKQTTRWIAADFKLRRRIVVPMMIAVGCGFYLLCDRIPGTGHDRFFITFLKYSFLALMIVLSGGIYAMLWTVEGQSKACLTIEEAASNLHCTPEELDSVLAARGIGPRFVVGTVPKYHPSDITGVELLLRPASPEDVTLLRPSAGQHALDTNQLLRVADDSK